MSENPRCATCYNKVYLVEANSSAINEWCCPKCGIVKTVVISSTHSQESVWERDRVIFELRQTIAALRARLKRAEESARLEHERFVSALDDVQNIDHALASKEAELDRYKRAMEVVVEAHESVLNCSEKYDSESDKAIREAVRRLGRGRNERI